jgi:glyoxylase-like metal-dependent hydrolase (beta-lactamase superfamily II)
VVVGSVEIHPVLDAVGALGGYDEAYPDVAEAEWEPYRELYPELFVGSAWRLPVVVYVLRSGGRTILVDTGVGPVGLWKGWEPEREGLLLGNLAALGIRPEDVDVVFLTHLHVDHLGWNTDERGEVLFPRARYVVHPDAVAFALARPDRDHIERCVAPLVDRFEPVDEAVDLAPGVRPRALPGHYPGHVGLSIRSRGSRAELIADIMPHPALLEQQEWVFAWDDMEQTSTRAELVEEVVGSAALVVCGHFPRSGIGRVVRRGGRVVWEEVT